MREKFASHMATKLRQLPEFSEDVEVEWSFFQITLSAVESCEQKRIRLAAGCEKKTLSWNQDVKEAIQAKKGALNALLQNWTLSNF